MAEITKGCPSARMRCSDPPWRASRRPEIDAISFSATARPWTASRRAALQSREEGDALLAPSRLHAAHRAICVLTAGTLIQRSMCDLLRPRRENRSGLSGCADSMVAAARRNQCRYHVSGALSAMDVVGPRNLG